MKTLLQKSRLVLIPETELERAELSSWRAVHDKFVFAMEPDSGNRATLVGLGSRAKACREPINVTSASPDPIRLISNFAATPFDLDGTSYACVEAFWQSLRFPGEERVMIAALDGGAAKGRGQQRPYESHVHYMGHSIPVGTYEHWQLMHRACEAKFAQNTDAREALLGTGNRPLTHVMRHDSRTIPGVIVAGIWMAVRTRLRRASDNL